MNTTGRPSPHAGEYLSEKETELSIQTAPACLKPVRPSNPALADLLDRVYSRLVYLAERAEGQPGARSAIERAAEHVRLAVERLGEANLEGD